MGGRNDGCLQVFPSEAMGREIQILAQLPAHHPPHLISMECVVLEELTGLGVIGFTTRFIDAPTMDRWAPSRPFKLRWLRELMGVLDELHLQYGIHHHTTSPPGTSSSTRILTSWW